MQTMNESEILKKLETIEYYSKLAAKTALSVSDVMLLTGLSRSCIYNMTHAKQIPFYKPNGKVLYFKRAEIEEWMLQNRQQTVDEAQQRADEYLKKNQRD